jgi:division protein CdvB (Snf7/Vps24/ESCRT-III family)
MSTSAGIFDSFVKILNITSRRDPQKSALFYIVTSLNDLKIKLEEIKKRLKDRDDELLANAVKALSSSDRERATIYAAEVAEVRKLMKYIHIALLAIERLLERMKTMNIVNDIRVLSTTMGILNELKSMFVNTMPELALTLDNIVNNVNSLITSTQAPEVSANIANKTKEVEDILREVEAQAEEKLKTSLPPIPIQLEDVINNKKVVTSIPTSYVDTRSSIEMATPTSFTSQKFVVLHTHPSYIDSGLELQIYNYIVGSKGIIKIEECAEKFGVSREAVIAVLKRLEQKGLIRLT